MKQVLVLLVSLMLCMFVSCYDDNINKMVFDKVALNISVSMENGREVSSGARAIFQPQDLKIDSSYYIDNVQGDPIITDITPVAFIFDFDRVKLFNPRNTNDLTKGSKDSTTILDWNSIGGSIIPNRVNMLSTKRICNKLIPHGIWNGLSIMYRSGGCEISNGMHANNVFCVKLPDGIDRSQVMNAIAENNLPTNFEYRNDSGYAWVGFCDVNPLTVDFSYLCLVNGVDGIQFINEDYQYGSWVYGPETSNGNQAGVVLPMDQIDFTGLEDPEFVFMFDTSGCLDIYEVEPNRYWISLKKSNPFPFKIITEEYDINSIQLDVSQESPSGVVAPPIQCFEYDWSRNGVLRHLIFTYTRPTANGIDTVRIYSSTEETWNGSTEQLIYEGNEYCFYFPWTEEAAALHYFITSIDSQGRESEAVSFLFERTDFEWFL